jgi:predicted nuclease with TOPRIM domain
MKNLIKRILKEEYNKKEHDICNIMSVDTYEEGIKLLENYLGSRKENPEAWDEIKQPLKMWKEATDEIRKEIDEDGMTGDSEVDESDTWWATIQGSFCK